MFDCTSSKTVTICHSLGAHGDKVTLRLCVNLWRRRRRGSDWIARRWIRGGANPWPSTDGKRGYRCILSLPILAWQTPPGHENRPCVHVISHGAGTLAFAAPTIRRNVVLSSAVRGGLSRWSSTEARANSAGVWPTRRAARSILTSSDGVKRGPICSVRRSEVTSLPTNRNKPRFQPRKKS